MTNLAFPPRDAALDINPKFAVVAYEIDATVIVHCKCHKGGFFNANIQRVTKCPSCGRTYQVTAHGEDGVSHPPNIQLRVNRAADQPKVAES